MKLAMLTMLLIADATNIANAMPLAQTHKQYPSLEINGTVYENACSPEQESHLQQELPAHGIPSQTHAWNLIHTIMCAPRTAATRKYLMDSLSLKVSLLDEATGERAHSQIVRRSPHLVDELMATGHAWQPRIRVHGKRIILQYYVNEVCIRSVTLVNMQSRWNISEIGAACD